MPMNRRGSARRRWTVLAPAAALIAVALVIAIGPRLPGWYWNARGENAVRRGARIAAREGCFSCHAPLAGKELANPGSRLGSVPSFFGGNAMMYVKSPEEIAHWIADGMPHPGGGPAAGSGQPFVMRPFKDRLRGAEISDLATFVLAADGYELPPDDLVRRGAAVSRTYGCESCHGIAGCGGVRNPGAFIGTVASWIGPDFTHLVRDRAEFGEWVRDGRSRRMRSNRAASYFLDRASLHMPAFGDSMVSDVDALWAYVEWARGRWGSGTH